MLDALYSHRVGIACLLRPKTAYEFWHGSLLAHWILYLWAGEEFTTWPTPRTTNWYATQHLHPLVTLVTNLSSLQIAASTHQSSVALFIVDLNRIAPYIPDPPGSNLKTKSSTSSSHFMSGNPTRKSFNKDRQPLGPKARLEVPKSLAEESSSSSECGATTGNDDFVDNDDFRDVFKPLRSRKCDLFIWKLFILWRYEL